MLRDSFDMFIFYDIGAIEPPPKKKNPAADSDSAEWGNGGLSSPQHECKAGM